MSYRVVNLGELAHIVGQQASSGSPRGQDPMPDQDRDLADNLMLLCGDDHKEIDDASVVDDFTRTWLRERKRAHEDRIFHLTGLTEDRSTTVIRMIGDVRGQSVGLTRKTAAMTVVRSADRYPLFLESYSRHGIEIDLRQILGESAATAEYYRMARQVIDAAMARLREGASSDGVRHLSVFAFARLPLLVYLGSCLDDTIATDIYQRHRLNEAWTWPHDAPVVDFTTTTATTPKSEAVLTLNVSGTIQTNEIPDHLAALPTYQLAPSTEVAQPDTLRSRRSLANFEAQLRLLMAHLERAAKGTKRLHVLPALPVSAAITLGRIHDPQVHPGLTIYDRTPHGYRLAFELPTAD